MTYPAAPEGLSPQPHGGQPEGFVVQAAAVAPIVGTKKLDSWLHRKHPTYRKNCERWAHVSDFYLGEVADVEVGKKYLIRRYQGEADQAYEERCKLADYTPHLGTLLDTIAGQLWSCDERAKRVWTDETGAKGLGKEEEPGTPAHRLAADANGHSLGWETLFRQFTMDIIAYQCMWVLIDTVDGLPVVKLVPPASVPNWVDSSYGPIDVLMIESTDSRVSLEDDFEKRPYWIRWMPGKWQRWTEDADGTPRMVKEGNYTYVDREQRPALPIFRVELPMRRYVAWLLSKKCQAIFNQESVRDHGLRVANFSKLVLAVSSPKQFEDLVSKLMNGEVVLPKASDVQGTHGYINPSSEPTTNASDVLKEKVIHLWSSGFKMFEDAAAQVTATEVKQRVATGIGAFLQLLGAAVDDAENGAFWRLEQAEFSESKEKWGTANVQRPDDYSAVDQAAVLDLMRKRYFGDAMPIPVGRGALMKMAKDAAVLDGLPVSDEEIEAAVDAQQMDKLLQQLLKLDAIPPMLKSRLTMRLVSAMGLVDPAAQIEMADGEKQNLFDVLLQQSEDLAQQQADALKQQSQLPPVGFGGK